jgi:hypothetical protein
MASLNDVIAVVRQAAQRTLKPSSAFVLRGRVDSDGPSGEGWYRLRARLNPGDLDRLDGACLAPQEGPEQRSFAVIDSEVVDGLLRVRTQSGAPTQGLSFWVPAMDLRASRTAVLEGLSALAPDNLVHRFDQQRLDPLPPAGPCDPRLNDAQQRASDACCAPGLQVVWGPPGTGKTHVIVNAIERLMTAGKRVLLVSNTNVAVDNAVEGIINRLAPTVGRVIRVGTPRITAVARDERVSLNRLVEARQRTALARISVLEEAIAELQSNHPRRRLAESEAALAGFDPSEHRRRQARRDNQHRAQQLTAQVQVAARHAAEAEGNLKQATADELSAHLLVAMVNERIARHDRDQAAQGLAEEEHTTGLSRAMSTMRRRQARGAAHRAERELDVKRTERTAAEARLRQAGVEVSHALYAQAQAATITQAHEWAAHTELHQSRAVRAKEAAAGALAAVRQRLSIAAAAAQPSEQDLKLLSEAEMRGLPQLHEELPALRRSAAECDRKIRECQTQHDRLVTDLADRRPGMQAALIAEAAVIATTLSMLTLKKMITATPFDMVIVDEAAAASLPELMFAVKAARTGATLLGDYLQNGPFVDPSLPKEDLTKAVYTRDCFEIFGLTDPATASQQPGCVVLTEQWRFGRELTELANRVAYGGLLTAKNPKTCEIVLVDTDGLGRALSGIRRARPDAVAGTWPIGALIARALAEYHHPRDGSVGIVTPYKEQAETTQELLAESACGPAIEVGTAHTFQGRECDIVVFDMVEDGKGWVAKGAHGSDAWKLQGLRLFNVATTRARQRLYLIGDGAAIKRRRSGPLGALRHMIDAGTIQRVLASDLLGIDEAHAPAEETVHHDLWSALQPYIRLVGMYDEKQIIAEVQQRVDSAASSVWMWSPWIGKHSLGLQDSLVAAHARRVEVRVMALPEKEINAEVRATLNALRARLPHVVLVHKMHQKIVVVDLRSTFVGSMNILSHPRRPAEGRHEVMIQIDSARFARQILSFELADQMRNPPRCETCGNTMTEAKEAGRSPDRRWLWYCGQMINGEPCPQTLEFPERTGRNRTGAAPQKRNSTS